MDTKTLMEWSAKYHTPNYGRTPLGRVKGDLCNPRRREQLPQEQFG